MATITVTPSGSVIQTNGLGAQSGINTVITPSAPNPNIGNQSNVRASSGLPGGIVSDTVQLGTTLPYPLPEHIEEGDIVFDGTTDNMPVVFAKAYRGIPSLVSLDYIMTNAADAAPPYLNVNTLTLNGATVQAGAATAMTVHYKFARRE